MSGECRLLTENDSGIFRTVRLRACKEEPVAFSESYEEIAELSAEDFKKFFLNGWVVGAFMDGKLVGISGLYRQKGHKMRHKGMVWGVYVAPEARGNAFARRMIEMLLAEAEKAGIERVHLSTDVSNKITVELYQSLGFEPWGVEKHITKLPDRYVDDVMMVKVLKHA